MTVVCLFDGCKSTQIAKNLLICPTDELPLLVSYRLQAVVGQAQQQAAAVSGKTHYVNHLPAVM
jgi:hypothetical protein